MVVIVGPPASGKSTIGRALADELGVKFAETDSDVEVQLGLPVADIFLTHGGKRFREAEDEAVAHALGSDQGVLVLGSGAVESAESRSLLANEFVVRLHLASPEAAKRAGITGARPVELGKIRSQWAAMMAEREPLYVEVANLSVDTGESDAAACVEQISQELAERESG
jgi:shikimate kinase